MRSWWYSEFVSGSRLAMPPARAMATVGVLYILLEGLQQLGQAIAGGQIGVPGGPILQVLGHLATVSGTFQYLQSRLMCWAAICFAFYRVTAFHPCFQASYRNWLSTTCWRVGRPLPLGPVTLTFGDAFAIALAMALAWHAQANFSLFVVPGLFAAVYLIRLAYSLFRDGPRGGGYAVVFGLFGMLMFEAQPEVACVIAVPTYLVAWLGVRRSLAELQNYGQGWFAKTVASIQTARGQRPPVQIATAWPFGYLSPHEPPPGLPRFDAACISILAGWALFCLSVVTIGPGAGFLIPDGNVNILANLGWIVCGFTVLCRLLAYFISYRPPISLLGRLATGRWIIPRYDRAFVAPIVSLLIWWWLEPALTDVFHVPRVIGLSVSLTLALLAVLVPGPTYRDWVLASPCRIVPTKLQ